jgi:hypothetical protein
MGSRWVRCERSSDLLSPTARPAPGLAAAAGLELFPATLIVVLGAEAASAVRVLTADDAAALMLHTVLSIRSETPMNSELPSVLSAVEANRVGGGAAVSFAGAFDSALALWRQAAVTKDLGVMFFAEALGVVPGAALKNFAGAGPTTSWGKGMSGWHCKFSVAKSCR